MTAISVTEGGPANILGFDGPFLRRLERLALINRRRLAGHSGGPRRSPRRGSSVEFADYRDYSPGDDFRRVDWKALARLDRLFLRLYVAEEATTLSLLLDCSQSMTFGDPPKIIFAARLAAILSYVAMHGYDSVAVAGWDEKVRRYYPATGGTASVPAVWRNIVSLVPLHTLDRPASQPDQMAASPPEAKTNFHALREISYLRPRPGVSIVMTDMLTDSDWRAGLRSLLGSGQEVTLIQILASEERDPLLRGDWKLRDTESGREVEITVSPKLLRDYRAEFTAFTEEIKQFCRRHRIMYLQMTSDTPIVDVAMGQLHRAGIVA